MLFVASIEENYQLVPTIVVVVIVVTFARVVKWLLISRFNAKYLLFLRLQRVHFFWFARGCHCNDLFMV